MRYAQWRQDAIELLFQEFVEKLNTAELGIDYKELFFQTIETTLPGAVIQWFEKYKLPYKEKAKGKHSFMRKDLFLYWCGFFCDRILPAKTEELIDKILISYTQEGKIQKEHDQKVKRFLTDIRLFTNTITQAVDIIQQSGIDAKYTMQEKSDAYEIKIKIPMK